MLKKIITNALDATGILSITRRITRRTPTILMYHRVTDNPIIPSLHPDLFEQQLEYVKSRFEIVSLKKLISDMKCGQDSYQLAITFDDGHKDFYTNAWPILRRHNLPATLFITTGFIDKETWLWPDMLRFIIFSARDGEYSPKQLEKLKLYDENRAATWNRIADHCLLLKHDERISYIKYLAEHMSVAISDAPQQPFLPLDWSDLREMQSQGLDIGSHTVSHPILSELSMDDLHYELSHSKLRIKKELGIDEMGVCYPNGMAKDTSPKVESYAQSLYEYGVVAYPCRVSNKNIMHLGRFAASTSIERFKLLINGFSIDANQSGEYK